MNWRCALVMTIPLIRYLHLQETRKWIKNGLASAMVLTGVARLAVSRVARYASHGSHGILPLD
jgi:hypothetical protein